MTDPWLRTPASEALSIDYLNFPAGYCPAAARAKVRVSELDRPKTGHSGIAHASQWLACPRHCRDGVSPARAPGRKSCAQHVAMFRHGIGLVFAEFVRCVSLPEVERCFVCPACRCLRLLMFSRSISLRSNEFTFLMTQSAGISRCLVCRWRAPAVPTPSEQPRSALPVLWQGSRGIGNGKARMIFSQSHFTSPRDQLPVSYQQFR